MTREGVRGVAGVATATPIFQVLFYKIVLRMVSKIFLFTVGYTNLKFLTPSLVRGYFKVQRYYRDVAM